MPTNLALTGTASAGNTYGADVPAQAIDGNVATKWQGAATNTWWKIDLGAAKNFDKFSICTAAVSYSMTIAGSLNDVDWATIVLAPYASRTALTDIVLAAAVTYRYVRLTYTDGANWSSLYEFQIWEAMPPAPGRYLGVRGRDRIGAGGGRSPRRTSLIDISRRATALGGTHSDSGGSVIHTFTEDGALTVITSGVVDVLIVAGGGGGGCFRGGGGGGGGVIYARGKRLQPGIYKIVVGAGGAGSNVDADQGADGGDSVFADLTAKGGGGGGGSAGGSVAGNPLGGEGVPGQGFNGGQGEQAVSFNGAAGGGGAAAAGQPGSSNVGGKGGNGFCVPWSTTIYFGGGGGGGADGTQGNGGLGGGGRGATYNNDNAVAGTVNTGGGGGGGIGTTRGGKNGGSGIVIIVETETAVYAEEARYIDRVGADGGTIVSVADVMAGYAAARSGGWLPAVRAWWSGQAGYKDAGSGAMSKWYDLGPNAEDVVQTVAGTRPTLTANQQNGKSVMKVDGGDQFEGKVFSAALYPPNTLFVVVKHVGTATQMFIGGQDNSHRHQVYYGSGSGLCLYGGNPLILAGDATTTKILTAVFNSIRSKLYVNGGAANLGNAGVQDMGGIQIAAEPGGGRLSNGGFICEIIVCVGELTDTVRTAVRDYLNAKWAVY